jgi:hypothetical protein
MSSFSIGFTGSYFVPEAAGFYEPIDGVLGVSFRPRRKFDYSIEAEHMSFELDRKGELAHVEIRQPRERWLVLPRLARPQNFCRSVACFPIPAHQEGEEYLTNLRQDVLCVEFSTAPGWRTVEIADTLAADISPDYRLLRLWIFRIVEDFGNKKELGWLKAGTLFLPHPI